MSETTPSCDWDVQKLLAALGPPSKIRQACLRLGLTPPRIGAVKMWRARKRIPGNWSPTILLLLEDAGLEPRDYMVANTINPF